jgi:hypothetical protein
MSHSTHEWHESVEKVYQGLLADFEGDWIKVVSGPGHIVFSDENLEDGYIDFCLEACNDTELYDNYTAKELEMYRKRLLDLKAVPEEIRCS